MNARRKIFRNEKKIIRKKIIHEENSWGKIEIFLEDDLQLPNRIYEETRFRKGDIYEGDDFELGKRFKRGGRNLEI